MEQINSVHIRGIVGSVKVQPVGETTVAKFTVATDLAYMSSTGCAIIETTWHYVVAWAGNDIDDLSRIQRGSKVEITGRLRTQRYTDSLGQDRSTTEILAKTLKILDNNEVCTCETK